MQPGTGYFGQCIWITDNTKQSECSKILSLNFDFSQILANHIAQRGVSSQNLDFSSFHHSDPVLNMHPVFGFQQTWIMAAQSALVHF